MHKKIRRLLAVNVFLIALIGISLFFSNRSAIQENENSYVFAVADTASISRIVLGDLVFHKQSANQWIINDTFEASPQRIKILLSIIHQVIVRRKAEGSIQDSLQKALPVEGLRMQLFSGNEQKKDFYLGGDGNRTFALSDDMPTAMVLAIPGYFINLYELLNEGISEWRDKRVLLTTWRTLQEIKVEYTQQPKNGFSVSYNEQFYEVKGLSTLDTANLFQYISQFETFRVQKYLEKSSVPALMNSMPFSEISIKDIYTERNNTLSVFPTDSLVYGFSEKDQQWVVIDPRSIENILLRKEYFEGKKNE